MKFRIRLAIATAIAILTTTTNISAFVIPSLASRNKGNEVSLRNPHRSTISDPIANLHRSSSNPSGTRLFDVVSTFNDVMMTISAVDQSAILSSAIRVLLIIPPIICVVAAKEAREQQEIGEEILSEAEERVVRAKKRLEESEKISDKTLNLGTAISSVSLALLFSGVGGNPTIDPSSTTVIAEGGTKAAGSAIEKVMIPESKISAVDDFKVIPQESETAVPLKSYLQGKIESEPAVPTKSYLQEKVELEPALPLKSYLQEKVELEPVVPLKSYLQEKVESQPVVPLKSYLQEKAESEPVVPLKSFLQEKIESEPVVPFKSFLQEEVESEPAVPKPSSSNFLAQEDLTPKKEQPTSVERLEAAQESMAQKLNALQREQISQEQEAVAKESIPQKLPEKAPLIEQASPFLRERIEDAQVSGVKKTVVPDFSGAPDKRDDIQGAVAVSGASVSEEELSPQGVLVFVSAIFAFGQKSIEAILNLVGSGLGFIFNMPAAIGSAVKGLSPLLLLVGVGTIISSLLAAGDTPLLPPESSKEKEKSKKLPALKGTYEDLWEEEKKILPSLKVPLPDQYSISLYIDIDEITGVTQQKQGEIFQINPTKIRPAVLDPITERRLSKFRDKTPMNRVTDMLDQPVMPQPPSTLKSPKIDVDMKPSVPSKTDPKVVAKPVQKSSSSKLGSPPPPQQKLATIDQSKTKSPVDDSKRSQEFAFKPTTASVDQRGGELPSVGLKPPQEVTFKQTIASVDQNKKDSPVVESTKDTPVENKKELSADDSKISQEVAFKPTMASVDQNKMSLPIVEGKKKSPVDDSKRSQEVAFKPTTASVDQRRDEFPSVGLKPPSKMTFKQTTASVDKSKPELPSVDFKPPEEVTFKQPTASVDQNKNELPVVGSEKKVPDNYSKRLQEVAFKQTTASNQQLPNADFKRSQQVASTSDKGDRDTMGSNGSSQGKPNDKLKPSQPSQTLGSDYFSAMCSDGINERKTTIESKPSKPTPTYGNNYLNTMGSNGINERKSIDGSNPSKSTPTYGNNYLNTMGSNRMSESKSSDNSRPTPTYGSDYLAAVSSNRVSESKPSDESKPSKPTTTYGSDYLANMGSNGITERKPSDESNTSKPTSTYGSDYLAAMNSQRTSESNTNVESKASRPTPKYGSDYLAATGSNGVNEKPSINGMKPSASTPTYGNNYLANLSSNANNEEKNIEETKTSTSTPTYGNGESNGTNQNKDIDDVKTSEPTSTYGNKDWVSTAFNDPSPQYLNTNQPRNENVRMEEKLTDASEENEAASKLDMMKRKLKERKTLLKLRAKKSEDPQ